MDLTNTTFDNILKFIVNTLFSHGVTFKNESYMSPMEDEEFSRDDEEEVDMYELTQDDHEKEQWSSDLTFPKEKREDVVISLKKEFGEPTEMRKEDPVWKFGSRGQGQVWVYDNGERTIVDVRYWYEKS